MSLVAALECPEHGVLQVAVPWASPKSRFTLMMERIAIDVLHHAQNTKAACLILNMSWDEVWGIMTRAVARGKARKGERKLKKIGVDEKSFRGGHNSYMTLVYNLENSCVEYITKTAEQPV
jgi:transposase